MPSLANRHRAGLPSLVRSIPLPSDSAGRQDGSYSVALGTPYWSSLPAGRSGPSRKPSRTASLTFARSSRSSGGSGITAAWDLSIDRQWAIERLFRLFPRDRKRLCCGLDPRRSSHFAPRFLICLKIRIAGSPSRTIFARLRSLAGNIIALTTAERSFIVP